LAICFPPPGVRTRGGGARGFPRHGGSVKINEWLWITSLYFAKWTFEIGTEAEPLRAAFGCVQKLYIASLRLVSIESFMSQFSIHQILQKSFIGMKLSLLT